MAAFFLALTGALLVWDLRQPRRFPWTLTRPQWRSWLTRGAYFIAVYGLLLGLQIVAGLLSFPVPRLASIWRSDGGVHQNLAFPVHPDPVSGMHCWHQKVVLAAARPEDRYGDVLVDTARSMEVYREWLAKARPGPGPDGLRRPLWLDRPLRPAEEAFRARREE